MTVTLFRDCHLYAKYNEWGNERILLLTSSYSFISPFAVLIQVAEAKGEVEMVIKGMYDGDKVILLDR